MAPTIESLGAQAEGALGTACTVLTLTEQVTSNTSITNGRLTASWGDDVISFTRGGEVLLATVPRGLGFTSPPPSPPTPDTCPARPNCTIHPGHDVLSCTGGSDSKFRVPNVTRSECCALCQTNEQCATFAYGTDTADPEHRHTCFMCRTFSGYIPRSDRDAGCVSRSGTQTQKFKGSVRNEGYVSTYGTFVSTPDEVIVGLGQHSKVGTTPCAGGSSCGQWKLNQKGFKWDLRISKYQIMVPFYSSSKQYVLSFLRLRTITSHVCEAGMDSCGTTPGTALWLWRMIPFSGAQRLRKASTFG